MCRESTYIEYRLEIGAHERATSGELAATAESPPTSELRSICYRKQLAISSVVWAPRQRGRKQRQQLASNLIASAGLLALGLRWAA